MWRQRPSHVAVAGTPCGGRQRRDAEGGGDKYEHSAETKRVQQMTVLPLIRINQNESEPNMTYKNIVPRSFAAGGLTTEDLRATGCGASVFTDAILSVKG